MNIHLNKEEHDQLLDYCKDRRELDVVFGSHLYGTNTEKSDKDIMRFYTPFDYSILWGYPNTHQFQYKDTENNIDYVYTTYQQFFSNLYNGDSTINADILMFANVFGFNKEETLAKVRTYKIIKSYLGLAKRDLKQYKEGDHKINHARRGLYCAECLLNNELPDIEVIRPLPVTLHPSGYILLEKRLRERLNKLLENDFITLYPNLKSDNMLVQKLIDGANTKEFKYDK